MASSSQGGRRGISSGSFSAASSNRRRCDCGVKVLKYTSHSGDNPGREFYRCWFWRKPYTCDFFRWVDEDVEEEDGEELSSHWNVSYLLEDSNAKNLKLRRKLSEERRKVFILMCVLLLCCGMMLLTCGQCGKCNVK